MTLVMIQFIDPVKRVGAFLVLLGTVLCLINPARAQAGDWLGPINLSSSDFDSRSPSVAVDPSGDVHVVWCEAVQGDGCDMIFYVSYDGTTWSSPIDIVSDPGYRADVPVLAADESGVLHMVWMGQGQVLYSGVYAPAAGSAGNWMAPVAVAPYPLSQIDNPDLLVDTSGNLHVVYAVRNGSESGVHYSRLSRGEEVWDLPQEIYANHREDRMVDRARLTVDELGGIHVAWTESNFPDTFPPIGIRYAYSFDEGWTWSQPFLVDGPYDLSGIIARGEEIHFVWSGTNPDRHKFHMWSADRGENWSLVSRTVEGGGYQGWPSLVLDSDANLHLLQVGNIGGGTEALAYQTWLEERWTSPVVLLSRPDGAPDHLRDPDAVVGLGDELHVVNSHVLDYPSGSGNWRRDIVYFRHRVGSPHIQAEPLPSPIPAEPSATAEPLIDPTMMDISGTTTSPVDQRAEQTGDNTSPGIVVLVSVLPPFLIVLLVLVVVLNRRKGR
jgi:hypothetical protein